MPSDGAGCSRRRIKVARLLDEYGLEGLGDELVRLWTTDSDDRRSLRELAERFNKRLFEAALAKAGVTMLNDEIASRYRLLTDDVGDAAEQTRVRRQLERDGVDVEGLLGDFVSYQAIRTYLTEYRDAEYRGSDTDPVESARETIQRLRSRSVSVTESRLDQLNAADEIALGEYRTILDLNVICEECGTRYDVGDLLDRGGCNCQSSSRE